jgi:hypothetical protein
MLTISPGQDLALDIVWSPEGRSAAISGKQSFCVLYDEEDAGNAWEEVA